MVNQRALSTYLLGVVSSLMDITWRSGKDKNSRACRLEGGGRLTWRAALQVTWGVSRASRIQWEAMSRGGGGVRPTVQQAQTETSAAAAGSATTASSSSSSSSC